MTEGEQTQVAQAQDTSAETAETKPAETVETQATTETKPAETTTEAEKPQGAPEKYEFNAPEGQQFDEANLTAFSEAAREANLSQEAAQKMLDKIAPAINARAMEQIEAARNGWIEATKSDKEFGGDKLDENLGVAKAALKQFGSDDLVKLLNETGLGNHPEVIRAFIKVGKAMSQDKVVTGSATQQAANDARSLYPNSNHA